MIEDAILFTLLSVLPMAIIVLVKILSWGLFTMGECLPGNYEPSCYSSSPNSPVEDGEDPIWFPHKEQE